MADTTALKNRVRAAIKANDNQEITGPVLQNTLIDIIDGLSDRFINEYGFIGIAIPTTTPPSDLTEYSRVFYLATQNGTYTNLGGVEISKEIAVIKYDGISWSKEQVYNTDTYDGVYDVSAKNPTAGPNNDGKFTLEYILNQNNVDTLIPTAVRKGGMSVKFVQSSDNKYVQYRCIADEFTTDTTQWAIADEGVYVENPEFVYVQTDKDDKILWAIKTDGDIYYGAGCPQQVKDYINEKLAELSLDEYEDIVAFLSDYLGSDTTLKAMIDSINERIPDIIESLEFLEVTTDSEDKVLEGIKADGTKVIELPLEIQGVRQETINNPEFIQVTTDSKGRIIEAIKADGVKEINIPTKIEGVNIKKLLETAGLSNQIICLGDSLTVGTGRADTTNKSTVISALSDMGVDTTELAIEETNYPVTMQAVLGDSYKVVNTGVGGEELDTIMVRQGCATIILPKSFVLPADKSLVEVADSVDVLTSSYDGSTVTPLLQTPTNTIPGYMVNPCYVQGIECTLSYSNSKYYLNRNEVGSRSVTIPACESLICNGITYRNPLGAILFVGSNGGYSDDADYVNKVKLLAENIGTTNYIVVGMHTGTSSSRASLEAACVKAFGDRFFNWGQYASTNALYDFGITPTQDDLDAMAVGSMPPSLRVDGVHLNAAGYLILGYMLSMRLKLLMRVRN